jgi:hypothetical protein
MPPWRNGWSADVYRDDSLRFTVATNEAVTALAESLGLSLQGGKL